MKLLSDLKKYILISSFDISKPEPETRKESCIPGKTTEEEIWSIKVCYCSVQTFVLILDMSYLMFIFLHHLLAYIRKFDKFR